LIKKNKIVKLILWDTSTKPVDNNCDLYTWSGYSEKNNIKSLLRYVDSNGIQFRGSYIRWIHELGESKIKGKPIVDYLSIDNKTSLWWLTSFVEKSPWKSPLIIDAVRLIALEDLLKKSSYTSFELVSSNRNLHKVLSSLCAKLNIVYEWTKLESSSRKFLSLRFLFDKLPYFLQALVTLCIHIRKNWAFRNTKKYNWSSKKKSIFICSQFSHLDKEACQTGDFYSHLWENLPELLHNKGYKINFIHHYLRSNEANNPLEALELINKFNKFEDRNDFHCFLYSYLSFGLAYKVLKLSLKFNFKSWHISDIKKSFSPDGAYLNLWPIMKENWYSDLCGSASVINCLWLLLFDKALKEIPYQECGLFLCENQSWEKALIYAWNKHKHGRLFGVAHSTVRFWDLRYFVDNRTIMSSEKCSLPRPDLTVLNGKLAMQSYKDFGSLDNSLTECEALRYGYLDKLNLNPRSITNKDDSKKVLILGDYMPKSTIKMLELLESSSSNIQGEYQYTLKPHPNFIVKSSDYPILNLDISMKPLVEIMDEFDIAYSGNLTSAALDAHLSGMPVIVAFDDEAFNFSPLRKQNGVSFVSNSKELEVALLNLNRNETIQPNPKDFFCLNHDLSKWSELLSL